LAHEAPDKDSLFIPCGVAVDDIINGNVLVVDSGNKFTSDAGKFMVAVGKGTINLKNSMGITCSIHSINKKVIVSDHGNHCIQMLNPNLTFSKIFGGYGTNDGQTTYISLCDSI
jgi:hypothetical protein